MGRSEYKHLRLKFADDNRQDRVVTEIPRERMSEVFERRTRKTWEFLRETLEARKLRDGSLSEMNERTLAAARRHCAEGRRER